MYYTVLYCTLLYCSVLCTVLYCTVLYRTVLYCTVLYCSVLYRTVLYYCHRVATQLQLTNISYQNVGRDSSVSIATRYRLDGTGIESRWGEIFRTCPDRLWGPHSFLYSGYRVSFPGVKRSGRGFDHPYSYSMQVQERVELCLYSSFGSSWPGLG